MAEGHGYFPLPEQFKSGLTWIEGASLVVVGAGALYLASLFVQGADSEEVGDLLLYAAVGIFFITGIALIIANRRGRERVTIDARCVRSRGGELVTNHSLAHKVILVVLGLSGCLSGILICSGYPSEDSVLPMDGGQRLVIAPLAACGSVLMLAYSVLYLARRRSRMLALSPMGLRVPKVVPYESEIKWSDLKSVAAENLTNATGIVRLESRGVQQHESVKNRIYGERISIGAAATYWLIRFYHRHPELRDELADDRARDRLLSYQVVGRE